MLARIGAVTLLLLAGGCSDDDAGPPPPPGTIDLCGRVTEDFRCQVKERTIVPGTPYEFVAFGPAFPERRILVRLFKIEGATHRRIFELRDEVPAEANTYTNNFSVRESGTYSLEVTSGGRVYAERTIEATHSRSASAPEQLEGIGDDERIPVRCAPQCDGIQRELDRVREQCIRDPQSRVRRALPAQHVAAGCCGLATGAYETGCPVPEMMRACLEEWGERCERSD